MEQELGFEGAGDGAIHYAFDSDTPHYVKRKLKNGLPVPVYTQLESDRHLQGRVGHGDKNQADDDWNDFGANKAFSNVPPLQNSMSTLALLKEYLCCPICKEICIETTTTNCGHKFCRQCIDDARRKTPICPICSTMITSLHRLYSDDLLIESQLTSLSPEVKHRFRNAQKKRLEMLITERKGRNVMRSVRRKLDDSLTYLRCKSSGGIRKKLSAISRLFVNKVSDWSKSCNYSLVGGLCGGAMLVLFVQYFMDHTNFFQYMWLAMKLYKGEIPKQWLAPQEEMLPSEETTVAAAVDERTMLEIVVGIVDKLSIF